MLEAVTTVFEPFALFVFGIFLSFPISAMFGAIALLFTYLPLIWQIL